jgi:hypothetical protein
MSRSSPAVLLVAAFALLASSPAAAAVRLFAYESANDATRHVSGDLTFEFNQRTIFTTVLAVDSTEGKAHADLKPADEHALGAGGLSRLIGPNAQERDLYQVEPDGQGEDLIHAFCPGSTRAWLAFSRLVEGKPLRVQVIGDAPGGGASRLCHTLDFSYRGEWKTPGRDGPTQRDLLNPHFPY